MGILTAPAAPELVVPLVGPDQEMLYPGVPLVMETRPMPLLPPTVLTACCWLQLRAMAGGLSRTTLAEALQPRASVTVIP